MRNLSRDLKKEVALIKLKEQNTQQLWQQGHEHQDKEKNYKKEKKKKKEIIQL